MPEKTVLVVDDDTSHRIQLRRILERAGYTVSEANNGVSALKKLTTTKADCILMDICMPEMDGFETTRQICCQYPNTIAIGMSVNCFPKEQIPEGMRTLLHKPFNPVELIKTIETILHASEMTTHPAPKNWPGFDQ